jgi:hypothetical protein
MVFSHGEEFHRRDPERIRAVFGPLGEYADPGHLFQAAGPSLQVPAWIERGFMEIGDHDHMGKVAEAEEAGAVFRLQIYPGGHSSPIFIHRFLYRRLHDPDGFQKKSFKHAALPFPEIRRPRIGCTAVILYTIYYGIAARPMLFPQKLLAPRPQPKHPGNVKL